MLAEVLCDKETGAILVVPCDATDVSVAGYDVGRGSDFLVDGEAYGDATGGEGGHEKQSVMLADLQGGFERVSVSQGGDVELRCGDTALCGGMSEHVKLVGATGEEEVVDPVMLEKGENALHGGAVGLHGGRGGGGARVSWELSNRGIEWGGQSTERKSNELQTDIKCADGMAKDGEWECGESDAMAEVDRKREQAKRWKKRGEQDKGCDWSIEDTAARSAERWQSDANHTQIGPSRTTTKRPLFQLDETFFQMPTQPFLFAPCWFFQLLT